MAYTVKRANGKYQGGYRDGQGVRRSVGTFTHKAKALRAATQAEAGSRDRPWSDPASGKRSWAAWADEWWGTRSVEASTAASDESRRRKNLDPRWAGVPVGAIRRHDVKRWAVELRASGMGASTVQRCVHLLSASLSGAVDAEIIDANPAANIDLPKGAQGVERFITLEEYDAILAELPTTNDQLIVSFLVYTGLRWGEMAGLHTDRLHLDRGYLRVVETFSARGHLIKPYAKDRQIRDVPLVPWLVELLKDNPPAPCTIRHTEGRCSGWLVFSTEGGAVVDGSKWAKRFRAAVTRAGVGHVRPHDLRHTYASWLLQSGHVSIEEVGELMGHISPATTAKYRHLGKRKDANALSALARPE